MWWGGRGQSFNVAPQKEEPEMGVRRGNGLAREGGRWQEGVNGNGVEKEGRKGSRGGGGCVSYQPQLMELGLFCSLKFIVSLSINQPLP